MAERQKRIRNIRSYPKLREYKATHATPEWLARFGAHAVGIGRKQVRGRKTDTLALRVYVDRKQPLDRLSAEPVPSSVSFISRTEKREHRLPTDVIETPREVPEQDPTVRHRPAPGGVSFGIPGSTGTLGGWVWDMTDDTIVGLSNNHVLGDAIGTDTVQPGGADGGSVPADKIGDVKRSVRLVAPGTNLVDCAITDADDANFSDTVVLGVGPAVYASQEPAIDMEVEKFGRTTRHTFGVIADVDYSGSTTAGFYFEDQIYIDPAKPSSDWSEGGDSGSLVFFRSPPEGRFKPAVGIHKGGTGSSGVASKIENVFSALNLTTICAGLFPAFLDALFDTEEALIEPLPVTKRDRMTAAARRFHGGISREVQAWMATSKRGRLVIDLVDAHRAEIADMLLKDGDVRRATVAALRPILAGATTSTDVLKRALTAEDLQRLMALADAVERGGEGRIAKKLSPLRRLAKGAEGKTLAEILGIEL